MAQKIVLEAMEIMQRELAQSALATAAEIAAKSQKAADAATAQASKRGKQKDPAADKEGWRVVPEA